MTPQTLARIAKARARLKQLQAEASGSTWCPQAPHPKQQAFLACESFEAFYGGAAGGGKSSALLMDYLQDAHRPDWNGLIIRRTFADLAKPGAIMDRAKEWLIPQGVKWSAEQRRFSFPSGASLSFGFLDSDADRYRWQGAELQWLGIDEATQIPEAWYLYLLSRVRRSQGSEARLRARLSGNPGGLGHAWVKARFVDSDDRGSRAFIPAKLSDNPSLDAAEYTRTLELLDPVTRRQLLEGIWVQDGSGLVYRQYDPKRNRIDAVPHGLKYFGLAIDYGFSDDCAWSLGGWRPHDPCLYILKSFKASGLTPDDAAVKTKEITEAFPCSFIVGDVGGLGKGYAEEARRRFHIPIEPADKVNKRGYIDLMNGALSRALIKIVAPECEALAAEWAELPWDEGRQKEASGVPNHCADSALYLWRRSTAFTAKPEEAKAAPPGSAARFLKAEEAMLAKAANEARGGKSRPWWRQR